MSKRIAGVVALMALALYAPGIEAQVTTERYIPVGQSPGMSGVYTVVGEVVSYDEQSRSLMLTSEGETLMVGLTPATRVWLDRSSLREATANGTGADLVPGRTVEVKYQNEEVRESADWIKVVIAGD